MSTTTARPGRPTGPETPSSVLRRGMLDAARMVIRARRILLARLRVLEKAIIDAPDTSAALSAETIVIMQALEKTVTEAGKLLVKGAVEPTSTVATAEQIMSEITKGATK